MILINYIIIYIVLLRLLIIENFVDRESKEMKGNVSSPYHQSKVVDSGYGRKKIASKQVRLPFSSEDEDEEELDSELSDLSD